MNRLQHLLLRQHILVPFFTNPFLRHTVATPQIAEFRHRKAQIGNISVKRIDHETYSPFGNTIPFSLPIDNPQFSETDKARRTARHNLNSVLACDIIKTISNGCFKTLFQKMRGVTCLTGNFIAPIC